MIVILFFFLGGNKQLGADFDYTVRDISRGDIVSLNKGKVRISLSIYSTSTLLFIPLFLLNAATVYMYVCI